MARRHPALLLAPALGFFGPLLALAGIRSRRDLLVFAGSSLATTGIIATVGLSMFPFILPSSLDPSSSLPMIGASGAISAVLGAYAFLFGRNKVKVANRTLAMLLNALWLLVAWILLNLIVSLTLFNAGIAIAWAAHIGGFALGLLLAKPLFEIRYRNA